MNLDDYFLSNNDKNNINIWLQNLDKPLFISGKIGIGKSTLANTILKDYSINIINNSLDINVEDYIYKTLHDTDISVMFNKKNIYKSIIFDNILYTDKTLISQLKNIIKKKYKSPIIITANNINNKSITNILIKCLHIKLEYTYEQYKYILSTKYNYIPNNLIQKSNFNFHMIDTNINYFNHGNFNNINIQNIDSYENNINILTNKFKNEYSANELFIYYSCDYNIVGLNILDDIYDSINHNNIKDLCKLYELFCIYDNYELFKNKYYLFGEINYSILYSIYLPYLLIKNSSLKLSENIKYNSYISKSLIYTHINKLNNINTFEYYDLLLKLISNSAHTFFK